MAFAALKQLLPQRIIANPNVKAGLLASRVQQLTEKMIAEILGTRIASEVRVINFHHGQLQLQAANQMIAQELRLREGVIKNKINQDLGEQVLKQVRYMIADH